jgi:hypothetical protein
MPSSVATVPPVTAVVQYLSSDVASNLRATYHLPCADATDEVRRGMFSTAGELAYLVTTGTRCNLAHETACTLRDIGDLAGATSQFHRSVRTRKAATFTRTHAVTLGYLGAVQARRGSIDEACATWSNALDSMDGVHSGRTRQAVLDMRSALSVFRTRGIRTVAELDNRAARYLASAAR